MAARVIALAVVGLVLVSVGLACSPWPWLAPVAPGAVLTGIAVFVLLEEVDDR